MNGCGISRVAQLSKWGCGTALLSLAVLWGCQSDPAATQFATNAGSGHGGSAVTNDASLPFAGASGEAGSGGESTTDAMAGAEDSGSIYADLDAGACIPGVPRCHGDFGYQMCEQDGTWGPPHNCSGYSSDGTSSYCVTTVASPGSDPWAACVDPACWYWISRGFIPGPTQVGICTSSTTIRQCNGGGTLSTETCVGVCTQVAVLDGRALGYCSDQCIEGARECLGGAAYRECQGGRWLAEIEICESGETCNPVGGGEIPEVRCGGDCDPGTSRCSADGASIESCSEQKTWEPGQACLVGTCRPAGPQAQCQTECMSDQLDCSYDGASTQRTCDELRQWSEPGLCPEATSCRISASQSLGCVECLGPATAGNEYGVSDSRCEAGAVVRCGEENAWLLPEPCEVTETCVELSSGVSRVAYCQP
jgi:hypothetical protein